MSVPETTARELASPAPAAAAPAPVAVSPDEVARSVTSTDLGVADVAPLVERTVNVLVYSDDRNTRDAITTAMGRRPAADAPKVNAIETATEPATVARLERGDIALAILDGEATPAGGMGICRQVKDEIFNCPPVLVIVGRPQDAWLATWSRADGVVAHPIDPMALARAVTRLLLAGAES